MARPVRKNAGRLLTLALAAGLLAVADGAQAAGPNAPAPNTPAAAAALPATTATSPTATMPASQYADDGTGSKSSDATGGTYDPPETSNAAPLSAATSAANKMYAVDAITNLDANGNAPPPPTLWQLEHIKKEIVTPVLAPQSGAAKNLLPLDIRGEAIKEAALSYGARGGLAWRTYAIRAELEARGHAMDKVFDFRQLLIPAPSGLLIEPPVVSEQQKAMLIDTNGRDAAVADRVYDITVQAKIVGSARHWRNYLERDWSTVDPPPDILRPNDDKERKKWIYWVDRGWQMGLDQADVIFQDDLAELTADYEGMIRYRVLLAQGIITPPYTLQTDRGVTGGGDKMRVGDRQVQITGMPELLPGSEKWRPASQ